MGEVIKFPEGGKEGKKNLLRERLAHVQYFANEEAHIGALSAECLDIEDLIDKDELEEAEHLLATAEAWAMREGYKKEM